jgi:hypothetical protein
MVSFYDLSIRIGRKSVVFGRRLHKITSISVAVALRAPPLSEAASPKTESVQPKERIFERCGSDESKGPMVDTRGQWAAIHWATSPSHAPKITTDADVWRGRDATSVLFLTYKSISTTTVWHDRAYKQTVPPLGVLCECENNRFDERTDTSWDLHDPSID